jgi:DNA sulfur modification protein DndD
MIFDKIVLHNFGVYLGRQSAILTPPSPKEPIVLFGGLNGGGKTTILDALQLALYGKFARCSNRGSLAYDEFLRRCVHRNADPKEGAAVELHFRYISDGQEHAYRVHRSWKVNKSGTKETVEVTQDGVYDPVLTESWNEYVEGFIPLSISQLFFFDGEKIEQFADLNNSAQLLSEAIHSLLGVDIIEQLSKDLVIIEQRKKIALKDEIDRQRIDKIRRELEEVKLKKDVLLQKRGAVQNELDTHQKYLRENENQYRLEGGELFEQRKQIEQERERVQKHFSSLEVDLRLLAGESAPLLLVQDLLSSLDSQDRLEREVMEARLLHEVLNERDERLIEEMKRHSKAQKLIDAMEQFLHKDREERIQQQFEEPYLHLSDQTRESLYLLLKTELPDVRKKSADLIEEHERLQQELDTIDRKLADVPDEAKIAGLVKKREKQQAAIKTSQASIKSIDIEIERLKVDIGMKEGVLTREIEKSVETEFSQEDTRRITTHSERVRRTLSVFREALVRQHIEHIQQLVLDSFRQLLRKKSLVSDLRISPEDFQLRLIDADGQRLLPDRLSAGERQLLAISLLWGLARASGRPLPIVVDTPLGRLDTSHRTHLVERYFPNASHQVLLLSTDEEIDERYYPKIKSRIGHTYVLEFDDKLGSTQIKPGYFW